MTEHGHVPTWFTVYPRNQMRQTTFRNRVSFSVKDAQVNTPLSLGISERGVHGISARR